MKFSIRELAVWSTTSNKANWLLLLVQLSCGGSGTLYTFYPQYKPLSLIVFLLSLSVMIVWSLLVLVIRQRYGVNILLCNLETGILYDRGTDIENVSLRRKTITDLLKGIITDVDSSEERSQLLRAIGNSVGRDFVNAYRGYLRKHIKKKMPKKKMIEELFTYDSSSGMGKFILERLEQLPDDFCQVTILNPFTCTDSLSEKNVFILGYLEGMLSSIFEGRTFIAEANTQASCKERLRILIKENTA